MNANQSQPLKSHIAFTIVTRSYLAGALVWRKSLEDSNTGIRGLIYITDATIEEVAALGTEAESVCPDYADGLEHDLRSVKLAEIPDDAGMRERYDIIEYCTAIKPSLFLSLAVEFPSVVLHYFDPDILVLGELTELTQFSENHSFTLIPHMRTPTDDHFRLSQLDILRAGVFNFGYVGWNPSIERGWLLIRWWQRRLNKDSRVALAEGIFTDQSWGVFFCASPESGILHDTSYNVAYWNLHEREIFVDSKSVFFCNDQRLQFFHFSGYSPRKRDKLSLHQNRHVLSGLRGLLKLCNSYADKLLSAGFEYWRASYCPQQKSALHLTRNEVVRNTSSFDLKRCSKVKMARQHADVMATLRFGNPRDFLLRAGLAWWIEFLAVYISITLAGDVEVRSRKKITLNIEPKMYSKGESRGLLYAGLLYWWQRLFRSHSRSQVSNQKPFSHLMEVQTEAALPAASTSCALPCEMAVIGYITAETGLGESVRGIIRGLDAAGIETDLFDIMGHYARSNDQEFSARLQNKDSSDQSYSICLAHLNADQVPWQMPKHPVSLLGDSIRRIGYWYWETNKLPLGQASSAAYFDEIWVATEFVRNALIQSGVRVPVRVIPPSLSSLPSNFLLRDHFGLPEGRPVCLSIFDASSFLGRKNPAGVIRAMQRVCEASNDKPLLVLKTVNLHENDEKKLMQLAADLEILVINRYCSREETLSLISGADCFISLHRAEGLGLSLIDAMRIGTPLVSTDYSGPCDFVNDKNAFVVPWRRCNAQWEDGPYFGSFWADPDIEVAATQIIRSLERSEDTINRIFLAKKEVLQYFSRERTAALILQAVR